MRIVSYVLIMLVTFGVAYAVATTAGQAISGSINQSAVLIADSSHAR